MFGLPSHVFPVTEFQPSALPTSLPLMIESSHQRLGSYFYRQKECILWATILEVFPSTCNFSITAVAGCFPWLCRGIDNYLYGNSPSGTCSFAFPGWLYVAERLTNDTLPWITLCTGAHAFSAWINNTGEWGQKSQWLIHMVHFMHWSHLDFLQRGEPSGCTRLVVLGHMWIAV